MISTRSNSKIAPKISINVNNYIPPPTTTNPLAPNIQLNMDHLRAKPKLSGGRAQPPITKNSTLSMIDLEPNEPD